MPKKKNTAGFGSVCVQPAILHKKVLPHTEPIYATSAYLFESSENAMELFEDQTKGYIYSRWGNPTVDMCAMKIAALETHGSDIEAKAQMFSSGMAAISAAVISCVRSGEKILTQNILYGTTDEFMKSQMKEFGVETLQVDLHDLNKIEDLLKKDKTIRLVYMETPSNPLIELCDIKAVTTIAKKYGVKTIVDNTFSTPYLQQPMVLGADMVVHSTTKFLNGHGTGLGGIVVGRDKKFMQEVVWRKVKLLGGNANAFDAWLILQGIKTLEIRMQRHCENARKVAAYLPGNNQVARLFYAGSKEHPDHKLAKRQMRDFGSMLSFELKGGLKAGIKLMNKVKLSKLVTSLGTVDTLIQHPASMTHVNVAREHRLAYGITDGLVRMSIGIETAADIIEDLEQALKKL